MIEKHTFFMPDYYLDFVCKMGACRNSCCVGWPIAFSLEDYFHLTSLACSAELREKMDRGIRIALQPTPDRYAQIVPRYDGDCSMRLSDGRCALHAELGENALTNICRLYPRGIHYEDGYEISCANSCEAVLEQMFARDAPIQFLRYEMEINMPEVVERPERRTMGHGQEIRLSLIRQMQDRTLSLPRRLLALEVRMRGVAAALRENDAATLQEWIERETVGAPKTEPSVNFTAIEEAERMLIYLAEHSDSIRDYAKEALSCFGMEGVFERYAVERARFEAEHSRWEICFEHMLVNHMFFSDFPFESASEGFYGEYAALCVIYGLLRVLCIGCAAHYAGETGFRDVCAATFRLIEHTNFDRDAVQILRHVENGLPEQIYDWITL